MARGERWPKSGRIDTNLRKHAGNIQHEAQALLDYCGPETEGQSGKSIPWKTAEPLLRSIIEYVNKSMIQPDMQEILDAI